MHTLCLIKHYFPSFTNRFLVFSFQLGQGSPCRLKDLGRCQTHNKVEQLCRSTLSCNKFA